jgi:formate-dependent phosphoribosylglycinamide formyltransferase (GAR transformylase)
MPIDIVFLEPSFPANQREFVRALAGVGARVTGIGERPKAALDDGLRRWLSHYEQVRNVTDEDEVGRAVQRLRQRIRIDRLEASIEAHVTTAARVRAKFGIPGTSERTTFLCRDKPAMKDALREAGVPCAQSIGSSSVEEIVAFAERLGYPMIVKPRDAAGASGTVRVQSRDEIHAVLRSLGVGPGGRSVAVEEFVQGHEGFYDTLTIGGEVEHEFVSHYYPNVLEAMRERWISPQFIATNRVQQPGAYDALKALGRKVNAALGIETSATHMEWFYGPKGLKFSEIGCRPPGVRAWDLYAAGNEIDIYREWAMAVVHGRTSQRLSQRYSAGLIAIRPTCDGHIVGYQGIEEIQRALGPALIDMHLPAVGSATQPVDAGYMANAWIRVRHPDYDKLRELLNFVGETAKLIAR